MTEAGRGVGRACAVLLASEGAKVAMHFSRDAHSIEETATACGLASGNVPHIVKGQLAGFPQSEKLVNDAATLLGGLDLLVVNALYDGSSSDPSLTAIDEPQWERATAASITTALSTCRAGAKLLAERRGVIVIIGYAKSFPGGFVHAASGAAALGLVPVLARHLAPRVRVNGVAYGAAAVEGDTPDDDRRPQLLDAVPLARFGRAEDAAGAALFLASEDASYMTAHVLHVDGGLGLY